jgi:hypothetical protein
MNTNEYEVGQRVLVKWHGRGWLPGTFKEFASSPDCGERFHRVKVQMDNGFTCDGSGYHPDCVKAA